MIEKESIIMNFIICVLLAMFIAFCFHQVIEYGPPCAEGSYFRVIMGICVLIAMKAIYDGKLIVDWRAIVPGIVLYVMICLVKYAISKLLEWKEERREKVESTELEEKL